VAAVSTLVDDLGLTRVSSGKRQSQPVAKLIMQARAFSEHDFTQVKMSGRYSGIRPAELV
tara:strand:+ start:2675 stop:2854 length:180 start_codon:yes stop_codon:yes gene_type:complete